MNPRPKVALLGLTMLAATAWLVKTNIFDVLAQAQAHAEHLTYRRSVFFLIPITLLAAPAALISAMVPSLWNAPLKAEPAHPAELPRGHQFAVALGAMALFITGLAIWFWFAGRLRDLGYST